jgi:hypothetical protein
LVVLPTGKLVEYAIHAHASGNFDSYCHDYAYLNADSDHTYSNHYTNVHTDCSDAN